MKLSIFLIPILFMCSCSLNSEKQNKIVFQSDLNAVKQLEFSGKGAGAGVMLMSSMGPMGIAIGVAIDEGIRKDIEASFIRDNGPLVAFLNGVITADCEPTSVNDFIMLSHVGFVSKGDDTFIDLKGVLSIGGNTLGIPQDVNIASKAYDLNVLKSDGGYSANAIQGAINAVCKYSSITAQGG